MANDLQDVRGSALVQACGPGAVVDFRAADGGLVSGIAAGLEEWDSSFPVSGWKHRQIIHEPRLEKSLNVSRFRTPPVINQRSSSDKPDTRRLVAVRFPDWLLCPKCEKLKPAKRWAWEHGKAYLYCGACTGKSETGSKVYVIPARFVMACERGHIDEFPWDIWVQHKEGCRRKDRATKGNHPGLRLRSERPGHAGLILSCPTCKAERSMDGAFTRETWKRLHITCRGHRPWLAGGNEECKLVPHAVLRGASNLYFPVARSALSIPPWSDHIQEALGDNWDTIINIEDFAELKAFVSSLARGNLKSFLDYWGMTSKELAERTWKRRDEYHGLREDLKTDEYKWFVNARLGTSYADDDFEIHREKTPAEISPWISRVVRARRLREVRAIKGFTRINPPADSDDKNMAEISKSNLGWLPALEVRGEGIFLALNEERLSEWERQNQVIDRVRECDDHHKNVWAGRHGEERPKSKNVTPRFMLCHTLAHALMRQLTLECGYSAASLRERIYAENDSQPMAGLLVYTATHDADGTLGGLERLGKAGRIEAVLQRAIEAIEWCSSDPLCISDVMGAKDSSSHSVCHACCLAPETSCEEFNNFLDRGLLIGIPSNPALGYFRDLIALE